MKSSAWSSALLLALTVAGGCGTVQPMGAGKTPVMTVAAPNFSVPSDLALLRENGRVSVGESYDKALEVFPKPPKAFDITDGPPGLPADYQADGWQNSTEGFGVLETQGLIALAIYERMSTTQDTADAVVARHEQALGQTSESRLDYKDVRFWFWDDGKRRVMICTVSAGQGKVALTVAVGDDGLMNALGMSPTSAERNGQAAQSLFDAHRSQGEKKS